MQRNKIEWLPISGVHSTGYERPEKIYLFDSLPQDLSAYRDSYIITMKEKGILQKKIDISLSYVDPNEKIQNLKFEHKEMEQILKSEIKRFQSYENNETDLYLISPNQKNAINKDNIIFNVSGETISPDAKYKEAQTACVLVENSLFYINKFNNKQVQINLTPEEVKEINQFLHLPPMQEDDPTKVRRLSSNEKNKIKEIIDRHPEHMMTNPIKGLKGRNIGDYMLEKNIDKISNEIHQNVGHTLGQYNYYEAEIKLDDLQTYLPEKGEKIETNDELSIKETIANEFSLLNNDIWKKTLTNKIRDKIKDPNLIMDVVSEVVTEAVKLIGHGSHASSHDPELILKKAESMQIDNLKRLYDQKVIDPRLEKVYLIENNIGAERVGLNTLDNLFKVITLSNTKSDQIDRIFNTVKIWIVTDDDPAKVSQNGFTNDNSHTFICFSQEDAIKLSRQIKNNQKINSDLLNSPPLQFLDENHGYANTALAIDLMDVLHFQKGHIESLLENKNCSSDIRDISLLTIELHKMLDKYISSTEKSGLINEINEKLDALTASFKNYINTHPYRNANEDFIFSYFNKIEALNEKKEILVQKEEKLNSMAKLIHTQINQVKLDIYKNMQQSQYFMGYMNAYSDNCLNKMRENRLYLISNPKQQAEMEFKLYEMIKEIPFEKVSPIIKNHGTHEPFILEMQRSTAGKNINNFLDNLEMHFSRTATPGLFATREMKPKHVEVETVNSYRPVKR